MTGPAPTHRIIVKPEGSEKWDEIGAAWEKAEGKFSLRMSKDVKAGTNALLIVARPGKGKSELNPKPKP